MTIRHLLLGEESSENLPPHGTKVGLHDTPHKPAVLDLSTKRMSNPSQRPKERNSALLQRVCVAIRGILAGRYEARPWAERCTAIISEILCMMKAPARASPNCHKSQRIVESRKYLERSAAVARTRSDQEGDPKREPIKKEMQRET